MSEVKTLNRVGSGPLLTRENIPDIPPEMVDVSSVFNPGAVRVNHEVFLLLRVQTRGRRSFCLPAVSDDGVAFRVSNRAIEFVGLENLRVFHNYDPRITLLEDTLFVTTALDTDQGCRCALWRATGDANDGLAGLSRLELVSLLDHPDTRNAVLFPEKIGGLYFMLHRPNQELTPGDPTSGSVIRLCASSDLRTWQDRGAVMSGNFHFWDELIGSGPPPIKTLHGWLHLYHGVATHFQAANIYQTGAVLLDLKDPTIVLGRTRDNILEPRTTWELTGQVPNVVFPTGAVVDRLDHEGFAPDDAVLHVYYGAADTAVGLARSTVGRIVEACGS